MPKTSYVYTKEVVERIGNELLDWAKKDTSFFLRTFRPKNLRTWRHQTLYTLAEKNADFANTLYIAQTTCLERLITGILKKTIDSYSAIRMLPLIWDEYRDLRREEMKVEAEANEQKTYRLVIDKDRTIPIDSKETKKLESTEKDESAQG